MLKITPQAAQFIEGVISRSAVPDPVVSIVATTEPLPVTDDLARAIEGGSKNEVRSALKHLKGQRTRVQVTIHPRSSFPRRSLARVSGMTFAIPLYMRVLFSLRLDYRNGELTFTDRNGRPVYPECLT